MKKSPPVKVAIIGLGFGAEFIPIYQRHPQAEVAAVCRRNEAEMSRIADAFKIPKRYAKYEQVLADPDVDFVHDFGAVEDTRPSIEVLNETVKTLMQAPITVDEDSGLLRTYALMLQHNLHDIPVVSKEGKLIGITSRVDIGVAILSAWQKVNK